MGPSAGKAPCSKVTARENDLVEETGRKAGWSPLLQVGGNGCSGGLEQDAGADNPLMLESLQS
jgi:hypothetical protein